MTTAIAPPPTREGVRVSALTAATPATAATAALAAVRAAVAGSGRSPVASEVNGRTSPPPRLRLAGADEDEDDWHICRGID